MVVAPEVIASVAAESALASSRQRSGLESKRVTKAHDPEADARMTRVKADIASFREAGIRQRKPKVVGHSWDRAVTPGLLSKARVETSESALAPGGESSLQDEGKANGSPPPEMEAHLQLLKDKAKRK